MSASNLFSFRRLALRGVAAVGLSAICASGASAQNNYYPPADYGRAPAYDDGPAYEPPPSDDYARAPADNYAPPAAYEESGATRMGDVIVRAPRRHQERDSATGAPIDTVIAQRDVRYDDLDLNSRWGAHELKVRIIRAAHDACNELDSRYTVIDADDASCVRRAVQDALYQTPIGDGDE